MAQGLTTPGYGGILVRKSGMFFWVEGFYSMMGGGFLMDLSAMDTVVTLITIMVILVSSALLVVVTYALRKLFCYICRVVTGRQVANTKTR